MILIHFGANKHTIIVLYLLLLGPLLPICFGPSEGILVGDYFVADRIGVHGLCVFATHAKRRPPTC